MIDYAKLTGNIEKDYIFEVKMSTGESLYAPMVLVGNNVQIPTSDWVSANKDKFLAVVTYQGSSFYDPIIMGFLPVKGAKSEDYNTTERMFIVLQDLIGQLLEAKVNTQIGPQPFMTDTIQKLNDFKDEMEEIGKLIKSIDIQ